MRRPENYETGCVDAVQGTLADDKLALASIAISMKRIADSLAAIDEREGLKFRLGA